ncbi:MAG: hypothetical protein PHP82_02970 [Candidatus ainarchaeum sp.]|nr:hypothetical protein [Candidatus ainarchaeum sp.]
MKEDDNLRGQISFESLLLLLVIITTTIFITTLFLQTNETTNAYSIIRSEMLVQTNLNEKEIILERVYLIQNENPTFHIKTIPNTITEADINIDIIKNKVIELTNFKNIQIIINQQ